MNLLAVVVFLGIAFIGWLKRESESDDEITLRRLDEEALRKWGRK